MKAPKAHRDARRAGTVKALAEARELVSAIRASDPRHLSAGTAHAARQVADLAERHIEAARTLAPDTDGANATAHNLVRALERAEAVLHAPEAWAAPVLAEALQLLGAAHAQALASQADSQRQAVRRRGKPLHDPDDADRDARLRRYHARLVAAGTADDATSATAAEFGLSTRRVRQILRT